MQWKRNRLMIQPAFHRDVIVGYFDRLQAISETHPRGIGNTARTSMPPSTSPTQPASPLCRSVLERYLQRRPLMELHDDNPFLLPAKEHARDLGFASRFRALAKPVLEIIEKRRSNRAERFDFLASLMSARDREAASR